MQSKRANNIVLYANDTNSKLICAKLEDFETYT